MHLIVSSRCLDTPKRRKPKLNDGSTEGPIFAVRNRGLRFVDGATYSVAQGLTSGFISANPNAGKACWTHPPLRKQLESIQANLEELEVTDGRSLLELACFKDARLFVGIADDLGELSVAAKALDMIPADKQFPLHLKHSIGGFGDTLLVSCYDMRTARRKFSTPNRGIVPGPYLIVGAVKSSGAMLRLRIWPIWCGPHFHVVRSNFERLAIDQWEAVGGSCVTVLRDVQLKILQEAMGGRGWTGDLSAYHYLPDILLLPNPGYMVGVAELFGLSGFRRYDASQEAKCAHMKDCRNRQKFAAHMISVKGTRSRPERYIRDQMDMLAMLAAYRRGGATRAA